MNIEIRINESLSNDELHSLIDFIDANKGQDFDFNLKPIVSLPGQMGAIDEAIISGIVHGIAEYSVNEFIHHWWVPKIRPVLTNGIAKVTSNKSKVALGVTISNDGKSNHFTDDGNGNIENIDHFNCSIILEKTFALLIGCSEYFDNESFLSIPPAEKNINDLFEILTDSKRVAIPKQNVIKVLNKSSDQIQKELYDVAQNKAIETLII